MKTIYLIRHGTTEWIEQGRVHGALNSPLSKFGEWEAQQAAKALADRGITQIFSSPQGRAMQTASFIAEKIPGIRIIPLDGLREMGFGKMEGKRDLYKKFIKNPLAFLFVGPLWFILLGLTGEKRTNLHYRVMDAWQQILSQNLQGNIAVVSHAVTLNIILTTLPCTEGITKKKRYNLGSCSISEVSIDEHGQAILTRINNTTHLESKVEHEY